MLGAEVAFSLMWVCVKAAGSELPFFQIVFFRSFITVLIVAVLMLYNGSAFSVQNKKFTAIRSVVGFTAMVLSFYALMKMNIGNAITLVNTAPIFVALLAPVFLKERTSRNLFAWTMTAFAGVIMVVRPDAHIFQGVSILALLSGLLAAVAFMSIRKLHSSEPTLTITFYFLLFSSIASFPLMLTHFTAPSLLGWGLLLGSGISGAAAQILMTGAYRHAEANFLSPFNNAAIIFSFLAGWLIWNEVPDLYSLFGAILIMTSMAMISIGAKKRTDAKLPIV